MGFEYGFSTTEPHCLTIWEGQFGDFANGAQVIIDQFISSGEAKWGRLSGLTLFLPHGYEGQGPEHSSARLERFLQLCAEYNMQVCVPSTPAQMFHMLRRQMLRPLRKPLIIMTPKSLLRHPLSVSRLEDLASGSFHTVIDEIDEINPQAVKRIVLCSGKVYFDLLKARREAKVETVAIVRLEQLYPFPSDGYEADFAQILQRARDRMVSRGAAEPGRLVSNPPPLAVALRPARRIALRGSRRRRGARHRHLGVARAAAEKSRHRGSAGTAARRDLSPNDAPSRSSN